MSDEISKITDNGVTRSAESLKKEVELKLNNVHDTYKFFFIILMGYALTNALDNVMKMPDILKGHLTISCVLFFIFLMFFVRVFLGNLRYLDVKYSEKEYTSCDDYKKNNNGNRRVLDIIFLFFEGLFFYFLSVVISDLLTFFVLVLCFLLLDVIWIEISYHYTDPKDKEIPVIKNSKTWAKNNSALTILLGVLYYLLSSNSISSDLFLTGFFVLTVVNTIIDIKYTSDSYIF